MIDLYLSILEITSSLILAGSAFYLARSVRKTTGRKQNTCFLNWHILNFSDWFDCFSLHNFLFFNVLYEIINPPVLFYLNDLVRHWPSNVFLHLYRYIPWYILEYIVRLILVNNFNFCVD